MFAIPSGYLSSVIGRKKTISSGITGLLLTFLVLAFLRNILYINIALAVGGIFWAFININSYPMIVNKAQDNIGAYTGVYYFFATLPAILSPMFAGWIIQFFGYGTLFLNAVIAFSIALFFMLKVED